MELDSPPGEPAFAPEPVLLLPSPRLALFPSQSLWVWFLQVSVHFLFEQVLFDSLVLRALSDSWALEALFAFSALRVLFGSLAP